MSEMNTSVVAVIRHTLERLVQDDLLTREPEQLKMINDIRNVLLSDVCRVAICEAGFGIERTWAALVSALPVARLQGKPLVIAVDSLALRNKLMNETLPALLDAYPEDFSWTEYLSPDAFVCRERLLIAANESESWPLRSDALLYRCKPKNEEMDVVRAMALSLLSESWNGQWSSWPGPDLSPSVQAALSPSEHCFHKEPAHELCPFASSGDSAADVIVTTHAAVVDALQNGLGGLPSSQEAVWIFDEAHRLVKAAQDASTLSFSLLDVSCLLSSLSSLASPKWSALRDDLQETLTEVQSHFDSRFHRSCRGGLVHKGYEGGMLPTVLSRLLAKLLRQLGAMESILCEFACGQERDDLLRNVELSNDLGIEVCRCLRALLTPWTNKCFAKSFVYDTATGDVCFSARLVNVSRVFDELFWSQQHGGVVMTSSVLSMHGVAEHFTRSVGLNFRLSSYWRQYASPIDYLAQGKR